MAKQYYFQLDLIKGLAILSVLLLHSLSSHLTSIMAQFYIWQAIPIFMIVMGVTLGITNNAYTCEYFKKKIRRLVIPLIPVFVISLFIAMMMSALDFDILWLVGYLPYTGPGNYFITLALESIILFPALYYIYNKWPGVTIIGLLVCDVIFELVAPMIPLFSENSYFYRACILRYAFAIGLGLWLSSKIKAGEKVSILDKKYWYLIPLVIISILYLYSSIDIFGNNSWKYQTPIAVPYALMLVIILFNLEPFKNGVYRLIGYFGKASYHLFLVQILFFATLPLILAVYMPKPLMIAVNIMGIIIMGSLYYELDKRVKIPLLEI